MLRRFFASSKPINFVIIVITLVVFLVVYFLSTWGVEPVGTFILGKLGMILGFLLTLGALDFVVKKNGLTRKNSYAVLVFTFSTLALPSIFSHASIIVAGLLIILALRRIFSLRSKTDTHKKIFDAAFWILIASLFYFPSLLFLPLLYFAIIFYCPGNYRNWLMPFASLIVVVLLVITYALYTGGIGVFVQSYIAFPTYDFTSYSAPRLLIPLSFFLALYLWTVLKYLALLNAASQRHKPAYVLVIITSLVALVIAVGFAPVRDGSELYFLFAPLSILCSRYVERGKSKWFNELLLWMIIALPLALVIFL
ncbi:MAG TPA: hypothetical protein ENH91_00150 [Leeuwenhoekiella sp.]|nr:hypothetical protein [Leeuwenhoekiella sp.]